MVDGGWWTVNYIMGHVSSVTWCLLLVTWFVSLSFSSRAHYVINQTIQDDILRILLVYVSPLNMLPHRTVLRYA